MQISHGHENGESIETENKKNIQKERSFCFARNMMQTMHHATGFNMGFCASNIQIGLFYLISISLFLSLAPYFSCTFFPLWKTSCVPKYIIWIECNENHMQNNNRKLSCKNKGMEPILMPLQFQFNTVHLNAIHSNRTYYQLIRKLQACYRFRFVPLFDS